MNLFSGILLDDEGYMRQLTDFYAKHKPRVLSCLPWVAAELADKIGFTAMLDLIQRHGGRKFYIATCKDELNKKLNLALNDAEYQRIFGHTDARGFVDLPSLWGIFLAVRRAAIMEAVNDGRPKQEIIQRFGITERGLRNYRKAS